MPARRTKKICENCGKLMFLATREVTKNQRFCSPKCASEGRKGVPNTKLIKPKVTKICEYCGNTFEVYPYRAGTARYCSGSCRMKNRTGKQAANWQGGKLKKMCLNCGVEYLAWPHLDKITQFCSKPCHSSYKNRGDKCNFWQGGKSFEPYPPEFNDNFKRLIRARDNYTCAICGKYATHVHHIDYVKENTVPDNCITLCVVCHGKTNFNHVYWLEYFTTLLCDSFCGN